MNLDGDGSFLDKLEGVRLNNRSTNYAEIRVLNGQNMQDILKLAMEHAEIHKFERIEPSLNEIFISTVGEDNLKAQQLEEAQ